MTAASLAVIVRKYPEISVGALLSVVVVQGFGYGLIFDLNFFLRNLSVIGGLLMVLSDSLSKKKTIFAGLPSISETDRKIYFQVSAMPSLIVDDAAATSFLTSPHWLLTACGESAAHLPFHRVHHPRKLVCSKSDCLHLWVWSLRNGCSRLQGSLERKFPRPSPQRLQCKWAGKVIQQTCGKTGQA
jgi:hypothetical protein